MCISSGLCSVAHGILAGQAQLHLFSRNSSILAQYIECESYLKGLLTRSNMKKYILGIGLVLSSGFMGAQAESAYVEQAATFYGSLAGQIGVGIEYALPSSLGLPIDTALEAELYLNDLFGNGRGFGATLGAKALILPSLLNEPAVALAVRADANINFGGAGTYGSIQIGPLLTVDFTPLTLSAGIYPAFANGGIGINYSLGARYYLNSSSNNAVELSVNGISNVTTLRLGYRLSF